MTNLVIFHLAHFFPPLLRFGWANCGGGNRHRGRKRKKRNGAKREKSKQKQKEEKRGKCAFSMVTNNIFPLFVFLCERCSSFPNPNLAKQDFKKEGKGRNLCLFCSFLPFSPPPLSSCMSKEIIPPPLLKSHRKKGRHTVTLHYIHTTYGRRNKV